MKMLDKLKRKVLLLLLFIAAVGSKAQDYQSYFGADSTRLNVYVICIDFTPTFFLSFNSTDTVLMNGQVYLQGTPHGKYGSHFEYEDFYFREDTITGKLYRYFPILDEEVLLCDMSLMVGDTFSFSDQWGVHHAIVESISFESGRKVIHFTNIYGFNDGLTFYEGIFPSYYPIGFSEDSNYGCDNFLLCEYKDGEQVFDNPEYNSCYIDNVLSIQEQCQKPIKVYPMPIRAMDFITIETFEPIKSIQLFDIMGREVQIINNQISHNLWQMNIPSCINGIYFIKTTLKKGDYYCEKVIVNN